MNLPPVPSTPAVSSRLVDAPAPVGREATRVHNRLQHLALGLEESRAFLAQVHAATPTAGRAARTMQAFEARWFGHRSLARVRVLMTDLAARYEAFPTALGVLHRWQDAPPETRRLVCHWHLQLADPLYRAFAGDYLPRRRAEGADGVDTFAVRQWLRSTQPDRWGERSLGQFAGKLLSAATAAHLLRGASGRRHFTDPLVPDEALTYLLYLLRETTLAETLVDNAYLRSVGLVGLALDLRLRNHRAVTLRRLGGAWELEFRYPSLSLWFEARS